MEEEDKIKFMRRCLELALKAEGLTYPNPLVGAVVVHNGRIIGEGYHRKAGEPHAEVVAVQSVRERGLLESSTLYVNLERCSHYGLTPPCADFIISSSIPRVVAGTPDPSEKVSGRGFSRLREGGCDVTAGVLGDECRRLNRRFFAFHERKRPYITLKWAQSADGFIDVKRSATGLPEPTWITGKPERSLVHKWRSEEQAILVGAGTVRADDPKLNVRDWSGNDPLRIVLSGSGDIDPEASVFQVGGKVIIFTGINAPDIPGTVRIVLDEREPACVQITDYLYNMGIQSLFIEGGASTLTHFIENGIWDEARIFTGNKQFIEGVPAPLVHGKLISRTEFSSSVLSICQNT